MLGTCWLRLGDVDGAIEEFRRATRLDPRLTEAHVNLAQALNRADRKDEARVALDEAQRLKEQETALGRAMVLVGIATSQLAKGEKEGAIANLRDAVAAAPEFAEAQYQLGLALRQTSATPAEAEDALLRAVQLDPGRAVFRYEWARSLAARGDTVGAMDQLRKAVELQPSLVEAHRELARAGAAVEGLDRGRELPEGRRSPGRAGTPPRTATSLRPSRVSGIAKGRRASGRQHGGSTRSGRRTADRSILETKIPDRTNSKKTT